MISDRAAHRTVRFTRSHCSRSVGLPSTCHCAVTRCYASAKLAILVAPIACRWVFWRHKCPPLNQVSSYASQRLPPPPSFGRPWASFPRSSLRSSPARFGIAPWMAGCIIGASGRWLGCRIQAWMEYICLRNKIPQLRQALILGSVDNPFQLATGRDH